ncbi:MAG: DUF5132 domain-containing protein [Halothece sp.]
MQNIQPEGHSLFNQAKNRITNHPMQSLAIGLGVAIVTPTVIPLVKPFAKAAIKSGVGFYEKTKGAIAETGESIGDIVAEAKAEAAAEQAKKASVQAGLMTSASPKSESSDH